MLIGGDAKGADLSVLQCALANLPWVVALGKDAEALLAVARAANVAQICGQYVRCGSGSPSMSFGADMVLSPACSSLDMFRNFVERGQVFADAVCALGCQDAGPVEVFHDIALAQHPFMSRDFLPLLVCWLLLLAFG